MIAKRLIAALKNYLPNLILLWLAILLYRYNSYYINFLGSNTQKVLIYLALAYTLSFPIYVIYPPKEEGKGLIIFRAMKRIVPELHSYLKNWVFRPRPFPKLEPREKTSLLFLLVKIFFLPIMLNFLFTNFFSLKKYLGSLNQEIFNIDYFLFIIYPASLALLFLIDTSYFSFGYVFEAGFLKNKVRSVDPTLFGWAVALICYPPFSGFAIKYIPWYANEYIELPSSHWTAILRVAVLLFVIIYVWATVALGAKCSNLTNRGIISKGPYAFVRHPAYISKNIVWWLVVIPIMNVYVFFAMLGWSVIYYFRAITEERHLLKDRDYVEYYKKVKYKFIPFVW